MSKALLKREATCSPSGTLTLKRGDKRESTASNCHDDGRLNFGLCEKTECTIPVRLSSFIILL